MTCHRICDQQRQPCPSAWLCNEGCNFACAELPKVAKAETKGDHGNPGYPFTFLDYPGNFWDRCNWWQRILVACALVALFGLFGGMVAGHLAGVK